MVDLVAHRLEDSVGQRMLQLADTSNSVDRAIGMMPEMVDKVADLFGKNKKDDDGTAR